MKAFNLMILAVMVLVLSTETQLSWAACDVQQLSPCLSAITSNTKPSQLCCHSLIQQKPCFCQYLKNPTLKNYVNSPAAKKAAKTCKVSIPKC
nr:non-specific lipid-transfer protein 2-like [Ipomoea batatas]